MKVVVSGYRMRDHGGHSGYAYLARLAAAWGAHVYLGGRWQWTIGLPLRFGLPFTGMPLYNVYRLGEEVRVACHMRTADPTLYHFLYGEASFRYTGERARRRGHRLLATFHLPARLLRQRIRSVAHLQLLTAIVCVSRSQFEFFAAAAPKVPRHHVPLGVDTAFFTPGAGPCADRPNLLCVGEHLRDWQTLLAVYERARVALHDCTLTVVTPPDGFPKHLRREGITVLQGLSDLELLQAYRSAHVLVLPLLDGTASNTALEAMACGIPVIASNIPSMEEYLGDEAGLLCPIRDLDAMVDSTLRVLQDSDLRRALGARARTRAELFNWPCIFEQLQAVYDSVMH